MKKKNLQPSESQPTSSEGIPTSNTQKPYGTNWKKIMFIYLIIGVMIYGAAYFFFISKQKSTSYSQPIPTHELSNPIITPLGQTGSPTPVYPSSPIVPCKRTSATTGSLETYLCKSYSVTLPTGWMENHGEFTNYDISKAEGREFNPKLDAGKLKFGIRSEETTQNLDSFVKEFFKGATLTSYEPQSLNSYKMIKVSLADPIAPNRTIIFYYIQNSSGTNIANVYPIFGFDNNQGSFEQILLTFKFIK